MNPDQPQSSGGVLKSRLGPMPVWMWLALVTAVLLGYYLIVKKKSGSSTPVSADSGVADTPDASGEDETTTQASTPPEGPSTNPNKFSFWQEAKTALETAGNKNPTDAEIDAERKKIIAGTPGASKPVKKKPGKPVKKPVHKPAPPKGLPVHPGAVKAPAAGKHPSTKHPAAA